MVSLCKGGRKMESLNQNDATKREGNNWQVMQGDRRISPELAVQEVIVRGPLDAFMRGV